MWRWFRLQRATAWTGNFDAQTASFADPKHTRGPGHVLGCTGTAPSKSDASVVCWGNNDSGQLGKWDDAGHGLHAVVLAPPRPFQTRSDRTAFRPRDVAGSASDHTLCLVWWTTRFLPTVPSLPFPRAFPRERLCCSSPTFSSAHRTPFEFATKLGRGERHDAAASRSTSRGRRDRGRLVCAGRRPIRWSPSRGPGGRNRVDPDVFPGACFTPLIPSGSGYPPAGYTLRDSASPRRIRRRVRPR